MNEEEQLQRKLLNTYIYDVNGRSAVVMRGRNTTNISCRVRGTPEDNTL